jgi:crossover junction endodeoxyribonuclease RusA
MRFTFHDLPPPLSACFKNVSGAGRAATPRYKRWQSDVHYHVRAYHPHHIGKPDLVSFPGKVVVTYAIVRPDNRRRDLDNLLKALNDALVKMHIIEDDSKIFDLRIYYIKDAVWPVTVSIAPYV